MHIRPAIVDDAAAIHDMVLAIASETRLDQVVTSTADDIARHGFGVWPEFHTLIAEHDGEPVGMCLYFRHFSTVRGKVGGYIQDLYLQPQHRGSGLAARLLEAASAHIHEVGGTFLRLSVDADNIRGQRFYAKHGMNWSEDERIFQVDGADFAAMATRGQHIAAEPGAR
ncbi:MAG TPA: GNAT family N-acetyltransferase [Ilumatobacteraceae bacterium]|nr:GNAT family N-acetyltransferase [Ilumatobacteraceae bacterium]